MLDKCFCCKSSIELSFRDVPQSGRIESEANASGAGDRKFESSHLDHSFHESDLPGSLFFLSSGPYPALEISIIDNLRSQRM